MPKEINGTAYVVDSIAVRDRLNRDLKKGNKVFLKGEYRSGYVFNKIVLLTYIVSLLEKEWFEDFKCCLAVNGSIIVGME